MTWFGKRGPYLLPSHGYRTREGAAWALARLGWRWDDATARFVKLAARAVVVPDSSGRWRTVMIFRPAREVAQ